MNITNSVASDVFGDMAEGNIGDFLRNLPGIDLELTQGEVRNVRLRGLGSEYNAVTIDGVSLASADANRGAAGDAREFNPRSAPEVRAAGFAETNGRATTIPGLQYQFFSRPKIHREGGYDNWFPSASLKYKFTRNFDFHFGYSRTIRRPTIRDVAGVWAIDDDNFTVNAPNPRLRRPTSRTPPTTGIARRSTWAAACG